MSEEKLSSVYVEVRAKMDQLAGDLRKAEEQLRKYGAGVSSRMEKEVDKIQSQWSKLRFFYSASLSKLSITELQATQKKLRAEFEKKIQLNADSNSLERTRIKISAIENALRGVQKETTGVTDKMSRWGMIATGLNTTFQMLQQTFSQLKQEIGGAVLASAKLDVLRSNFSGSAQELELFRTATAGTVSDANLIKLSNQASALGLSLEEQAKFFSLAEDAGDAYGVGVEEGMQKIILATEGNVRGLKRLGIQKAQYEQTVKQMAMAHGTEISNLDAETQKQIRLQAVLKLTGITLEQVKNKTKDNADKMEALSVRVEQAKTDFGGMIAKGLLPLIDGFEKSGKGMKDFVSTIIGVGGIVVNLIPLIANLVIAKSTLATQAIVTAGAMDTATGAITRNSVAVTGWLAKAGALFAGITAGLFVVNSFSKSPGEWENAINEWAGKLVLGDKFEDETKRVGASATELKVIITGLNRQIESMEGAGKKETSAYNEAVLKRNSYLMQFNSLMKKSAETSATTGTVIVGEVEKIKSKINELTAKNSAKGISLVDYQKNEQEISRLSKLLSGETQKQTKDTKAFIEQTWLMSEDSYNKKIALVKAETLENIKAGADRISAYALETDTLLKLANQRYLAKKKIDDKEKEDKKKEIGYSNIPGMIKSKQGEVQGVGQGEKPPIYTPEQFEQMEKDFQKSAQPIQEIANTIGDSFASAFDSIKISASESNNVLQNVFVNMANGFIAQVQRMAAEWLSFKLLSWIGGALLAPVTGGASLAVAAQGGTFEGGRKVKGYAGGGSFMVPGGYEGDRFPLLVSSGERVSVTPSGAVGQQEKLLANIVNSIQAMNMNLVNKNLSVHVHSKVDGLTFYEGKVAPAENRSSRSGKVVNAL